MCRHREAKSFYFVRDNSYSYFVYGVKRHARARDVKLSRPKREHQSPAHRNLSFVRFPASVSSSASSLRSRGSPRHGAPRVISSLFRLACIYRGSIQTAYLRKGKQPRRRRRERRARGRQRDERKRRERRPAMRTQERDAFGVCCADVVAIGRRSFVENVTARENVSHGDV